ncbi:S41 family peptidase [Confluentibacter sediminis]|uniref:S41 family peptidase n=1 Tax=Confluentibacter sediminis TaxID=2219045 RepID=UPI0013A6CD60|nr:S41 family peptidase [Confluentibacter sediminis]
MNKTYIFLLLIIFSCSTTKKVSTEYSSANNISEFNKFIEDFEKNYIYLTEKNELWKCIKGTYSEKVGQITTKFEHILFYENLLNELYDNHIHLNTNTSQSYRLDTPIYVTNNNGKTYLKNVWQTQLKDTIKENVIGAEIVTFNGIDFQEKIKDFTTICQNKNDKKVREWIANKIVAGKRNESRVLELKLQNGKTFKLDIDSLKLREEKFALSPSIIENKSIGLIRVNNTLGNQILVKEFKRVIPQMDSTKALIIDLRNTISGGNTSVAKPIMGIFINEKKPYQLYENHKKEYLGYVKPNKLNYNKPVYILVNRWTGSMGEGIAIGLNTVDGIEVIGTEMSRLAGGMKSINFKNHNYGFQVSFEKIFDINGNPREEFIPKNYVEQTRTDTDEILEYTIERIKTVGKLVTDCTSQ